MRENNLFNYATKELSQDAILCWLINWVNSKEDLNEYKLLQSKAKSLLNYILKGKKLEVEDFYVKVIKQYKNIDVYVELTNKKNDKIKYAIIIEDKKFTTENDNQISKYTEKIIKATGLNRENIITVYYKPYDEIYNIQADVIIYREEMLKNIFNDDIENDIYMDYKEYLENIENICVNIKNIPVRKWKENKELCYKFASEYNKNIVEDRRKVSITIRGSSTYIDWYKIKTTKEYAGINYIYLNYDLNNFKIIANVEKYDEESRRKLEVLINKISNELGLKNIKNTTRTGEKTINLAKYKIKTNITYSEFLQEIEKMEKLMEEIKAKVSMQKEMKQ